MVARWSRHTANAVFLQQGKPLPLLFKDWLPPKPFSFKIQAVGPGKTEAESFSQYRMKQCLLPETDLLVS
ncbi:hypothetical protein IMPR6_190064 [Imperialibacter sp. EC-SDR9]|nr:hypothetical protein IMPERIA89_120064 [Imperialibacter sp. 89]CAD5283967.1 hypothetical protein IMPERIA75_550064 [Imperialibacter sp. 75]VVT10785.1 hypothetical protein IMPR6_190064 [Imperialibacter sp. EC-SDR9]